VAQPDALDQYFIKYPNRFFERPLEAAVADPDNPKIVGPHLACAAAEEPLVIGRESQFDLERHKDALDEMLQKGRILLDAEGERYFSAMQRPQRMVDLRGAGDTFAIVGPGGRVIGSLDGVRVYKEGYPGAVYLHRAKSYVIRSLDWEQRKVFALPAEAAYYTRARSDKETEILEETGRMPVANFLIRQGRLRVTETITAYERRHIRGGELLGVFDLEMPELTFETHGFWLDIEKAVRVVVEKAGRHFMGSIHALEHAAIAMFPLFALCDRGDIGGISIPLHPQTKKAAVFIYDGIPGGVGLAERGFEIIEELLVKVEELLAGCDCDEGCPACVYSPKCGSGNKPLDKEGALLLTRALLGRVDLEESQEEPAPMISLEDEVQEKEKGDPRFGVMDLETQRLAGEVGGWGNSHLMMVSVGVVYDSQDDKCHAYGHKKVSGLIKHLGQVDLVIGFNIMRFDYKVLSAYTPQKLQQLPTLDLLMDVHKTLGFRLSLQALGEATLDAGKSADGLQAVEWWRSGELEKITKYCIKDVELTRDLFLFGQEKGYLLYINKQGNKLRIPVDWSWESLKKRFFITIYCVK
jgi:DEAD/DEAH box helicase domain-containing protein